MRHRVDSLIAALKKLPEPEQCGQTRQVPVFDRTVDFPIASDSEPPVEAEVLYTVTVKAERFANPYRRWLEWTIEI